MLIEAERAAKMCSWTWDIQTDSFGWSESACDVFNIDLDFTLSYEKFLRIIHSDDREEVKKIVEQIFCNKQFSEFSFRIMNSKGETKDLVCNGEIMLDHEGKVARAVGTLQDVTEKKNYIKYIEEKNRQLADIAQLQSHAVRNHVANILGLCEILDIDGSKVEESSELIKQLGLATQKLDEITKSIVGKTYH